MFDKIRRLTGHVLVYGFGNAGNRVVGFLLIPIYSRYLTPEDSGVLALVSMLGQVLGSIPAALVGKGALLLSAPLLLYAIGFFEPGEAERLKRLLGGFRRGSGALIRAQGSGK